jgi:hypothetical protein
MRRGLTAATRARQKGHAPSYLQIRIFFWTRTAAFCIVTPFARKRLQEVPSMNDGRIYGWRLAVAWTSILGCSAAMYTAAILFIRWVFG